MTTSLSLLAICLFVCGTVVVADNSQLTRICPSTIDINTPDVWLHDHYCLQLVFNEHDWQQARAECQKHGGDLVQIRTAAMQSAIENHLREQHRNNDGFWIGATDEGHTGTWNWVAGDPNMHFDHWHRGQGPHQSGFIFPSFEHCAMMRVDNAFYWHDYSCGLASASSICQYDMTATTTTTTTTATTTSDKIGIVIG